MKAMSPLPPGAESPEARALVRKQVELWRQAFTRGDAHVLAQAVVQQRAIPARLRASLDRLADLRAA